MEEQEISITDYLKENLIELDLKAKTKDEVLDELSKLLGASHKVTSIQEVKKALDEREKIGSTGVGKGVAIPHAKTESVESLTIALGISKTKINFNSLDNEPVSIFFVFASPKKDTQKYLRVLARISRFLREPEFKTKIQNCNSTKEIIECIESFEGAKI